MGCEAKRRVRAALGELFAVCPSVNRLWKLANVVFVLLPKCFLCAYSAKARCNSDSWTLLLVLCHRSVFILCTSLASWSSSCCCWPVLLLQSPSLLQPLEYSRIAGRTKPLLNCLHWSPRRGNRERMLLKPHQCRLSALSSFKPQLN